MSTYSRSASSSPKRTYRGTTRQFGPPYPLGRSAVESRTIAVESADRRTAPRSFANRPHDLVQPSVLRQAGDGPRVVKGLHFTRFRSRREDDDGGLRKCPPQPRGRLDPVEARQAVVDEHDVGRERRTDLERGLTIGQSGDDADVGR